MESLQKLYEIKSRVFKDMNLESAEYFKLIDQIRTRPNKYAIPQKKISMKRFIYEPFKDPLVIRENKKNKLRLYSIIEEPVSPRLNYEYLELRERMKNSREKCREIVERALSLENEKFQNRVFNQRPRIDEIKGLKIKWIKNSKTKDYESDYRDFTKKSKDLFLPDINAHKETKSDKIFKTEINTDNNSKDEQYIENAQKMKDHKYKDISHQRPIH